MRRGIPKLFQNRWIHRRPLRFHGDAEKVARSNRIREQIAAPSPLAPPLEHESQQCQLSRPTCRGSVVFRRRSKTTLPRHVGRDRSEEHTSELQSRPHLVCRLLLEKKKKKSR